MNESSRRCRRVSCSIRTHNHKDDDISIYFKYPNDYWYSNYNISHCKLISDYKIVKYGKYDVILIIK